MTIITIDMDALARAIDCNTDATYQEARSIINAVLYAAPNAGAPLAGKYFDAFLCRAWGETDLPSAEIVSRWEGVRRFMAREWLGEEGATDDDGEPTLDRFKADFDEHEEDKRGGPYVCEFEIGGVSVERITGWSAAPAQQAGKLSDGARMRCRKCGEQNVIEFNYAQVKAEKPSCCGQTPCAHPGVGPCDKPAQQAGAPLTLTEEQREDVLDALRNTHGLAGDVEEMLDAVLEEVAAVGAPLPLLDTQIDAAGIRHLGVVQAENFEREDERRRAFARECAAMAGAPLPLAPSDPADAAEPQPRLKVRLTCFPESNGKTNWTALLVREEEWDGLVGNCGGISLAHGELWNRVAYEAEQARFLIGQRDNEPFILDYGDDIKTPEEWKGETDQAKRAARAPGARGQA